MCCAAVLCLLSAGSLPSGHSTPHRTRKLTINWEPSFQPRISVVCWSSRRRRRNDESSEGESKKKLSARIAKEKSSYLGALVLQHCHHFRSCTTPPAHSTGRCTPKSHNDLSLHLLHPHYWHWLTGLALVLRWMLRSKMCFAAAIVVKVFPRELVNM